MSNPYDTAEIGTPPAPRRGICPGSGARLATSMWQWLNEAQRRRFVVRCPACGQSVLLTWDGVLVEHNRPLADR
jgi:phage terminase large subunit GpA-like protein